MNIPEPTVTTSSIIYDTYKTVQKPRYYLGWSEIGHICDRYLWLSFRKAFSNEFPARILRLFDTGHREEERILEDLARAGCQVECLSDDGISQIEVPHLLGGHIRGHIDAVVTGLPEAPKTKHLVDVKTVNLNNFKKLQKDGFKDTFPKYYAQAQGYMGLMGLTRAMYIFVVKDNETIHCERIRFSKKDFEFYCNRAMDIVMSQSVPAPISEKPETWYRCKFCPAKSYCTDGLLEQNCRTCTNMTPGSDGTWYCCHHGARVPNEDQFYKHNCYSLHEDIPF